MEKYGVRTPLTLQYHCQTKFLPVILNEAAGVVKDLVERDRPVIQNGVKDLGERNNAFILCGYGEVYQILR